MTVRRTSRGELEATSRVLNTAELLEAILLFVAPSDLLLRVQLTCKGFQHATTTSLALRRKMFREPNCKRTQIAWFPFSVRGHKRAVRLPSPTRPGSIVLHIKNRNQALANLKHHTTLRSLLIVQPPLHHASITIRSGFHRKSYHSSASTGIRFGDVLEKVGRYFAREKRSLSDPYVEVDVQPLGQAGQDGFLH